MVVRLKDRSQSLATIHFFFRKKKWIDASHRISRNIRSWAMFLVSRTIYGSRAIDLATFHDPTDIFSSGFGLKPKKILKFQGFFAKFATFGSKIRTIVSISGGGNCF